MTPSQPLAAVDRQREQRKDAKRQDGVDEIWHRRTLRCLLDDLKMAPAGVNARCRIGGLAAKIASMFCAAFTSMGRGTGLLWYAKTPPNMNTHFASEICSLAASESQSSDVATRSPTGPRGRGLKNAERCRVEPGTEVSLRNEEQTTRAHWRQFRI
jgi:hypothetical protein